MVKMIIGDPYKFSIFTKKIEEWSDDGYQNGVFLICIDGVIFPKELYTSTLGIDVFEIKKELSNIAVNKELFNLPTEEAFEKMYFCTFPSWEDEANGIDQDFCYFASPPGLLDYNSLAFAVSNGEKVRIMAAQPYYDATESVDDLANADIKEAVISHEELNQILVEIEAVIVMLKNKGLPKVLEDNFNLPNIMMANMIMGDPYKFSIFTKKIEEWNDDGYQNGVFLLCIDGIIFPKEVYTSTLGIDIYEIKDELSSIAVNEELFNLPKEKAFEKMYFCTFPKWEDEDKGVRQDFRYFIYPPGLHDYSSLVFAVSNGDEVRIMAAQPYYDETESVHDLANADIMEAIISHEELNNILAELEGFIVLLESKKPQKVLN